MNSLHIYIDSGIGGMAPLESITRAVFLERHRLVLDSLESFILSEIECSNATRVAKAFSRDRGLHSGMPVLRL